MAGNILIPDPRYDAELQSQIRSLLEERRVAYELAHPVPPLENVRHPHDPRWRENKFWSVQAAHDMKGGWKVVGALFFLAQFIGPML